MHYIRCGLAAPIGPKIIAFKFYWCFDCVFVSAGLKILLSRDEI